MIRHVRRHFICFTMCILTGAVLLPMIALNVIPAFMSYNQNKRFCSRRYRMKFVYAVQNPASSRINNPQKMTRLHHRQPRLFLVQRFRFLLLVVPLRLQKPLLESPRMHQQNRPKHRQNQLCRSRTRNQQQ